MSDQPDPSQLAQALTDLLATPELNNEEAAIALEVLAGTGIGPAASNEAAGLALARFCFQNGKLSVSVSVVPLMEAVA